jgi:hypothetical protein
MGHGRDDGAGIPKEKTLYLQPGQRRFRSLRVCCGRGLRAGTLPATFTCLMPTFFYPTVEVEACAVA